MYEEFINQLEKWAIEEPLIQVIILIGSYVRGTQKPDSDIDVVIITSDKQHYTANPQIFNFYEEIDKSNIEHYGECTSVRIWYKSGLEVEYGMVSLKWVDVPLDAGTHRVLSDGYRILLDKEDVFLTVIPIVPEYF